MINKLFITVSLFFAHAIYAQNTCDLFTINFDFELNGYFILTTENDRKLIENIDFIINYSDNQVIFISPAIPRDENYKVYLFKGIAPSDSISLNYRASHYLQAAPAWHLSSIPQGQPDLFPEAELNNRLECGFKRSRIAWYQILSDLQRSNSGTPKPLKNNKDEQSNHFVREVYEKDLFPDRESPNNYPQTLRVLNVVHYPKEMGLYNFDTYKSKYSEGLDKDGSLRSPETRWSGIMRELNPYVDCHCVDTLYFMLMDPFIYNQKHKGGKLYINIGNISEDILKDSKISSESASDNSKIQTAWGMMSEKAPERIAFSDLKEQDVGFDGLNDEEEKTFFSEYLNKLYTMARDSILDMGYYYSISDDVSNDNYMSFVQSFEYTDTIGILEAYKYYNGSEKNSTSGTGAATRQPDCEDLNRNDALDTLEAYYQYEIDLSPDKLKPGINYINRVIDDTKARRNGEVTSVNWYEFKIPVHRPDTIINGGPQAGKPEFMRLFFRDFEEEVVLRFAEMAFFSGISGDIMYYKNDIEGEFLMYPNPTNGKFYIDFKGQRTKSVKIFDLKGQLIYSRDLKKESMLESEAITSQINNPNITFEVVNDVIEIDTGGFKNGLYIVHVNCADTTYTRKLIFNSLK